MEAHPRESVMYGTTSWPTAATKEPEPLIRPTTVPRACVLPAIEGCSARSAATADVTMLLGPPMRIPIAARMTMRRAVLRVSAKRAMTMSSGQRMIRKTTTTQPRRPPRASETMPTIMPPGIMPTS